MPLEFAFLADRLNAIPVVSQWYFDEWGPLSENDSVDGMKDLLLVYANRYEIPFMVIATEDKELVGAAQLKYHELEETFPDKEHWLGSIYVAHSCRGRGYGSQIVEHMVNLAPRYGIHTLHLQTEALDGGLYTRLGWTACALARNRGVGVLVMTRHLSD